MTQKFTAEEVRAVAASFARVFNEGVSSMLTAYADTLSKPADSGRVTSVMVAQFKIAFHEHSTISPEYDGCIRAGLRAALAAQGQGEKMPVPSSLDRTHKIKSYVTLGFGSEQECTRFCKAIRMGRGLYATPTDSPAGVPDGMVVGYCTRADAKKMLSRKAQANHNFSAIEVWNKQSEFYSVPVFAFAAASASQAPIYYCTHCKLPSHAGTNHADCEDAAASRDMLAAAPSAPKGGEVGL